MSRAARRRVEAVSSVLLAGYWLVLFTATHLPRVPEDLASTMSDKWQHYLAYALLGVALAGWKALRTRLSKRDVFVILLIGAAYGAFDELTQPWFGREADLLDWRSDVIGFASGVALVWLVLAVCSRRSPRTA